MFHFSHAMLATWIALGAEVSLFVLIPIYLRMRWRREIQSRIRIIYDSRRPEDFRSTKVLPFARRQARPDRGSLRRRIA